jgi:hypothetical protein
MRKTAEIGAFADYRRQARHRAVGRRNFGFVETTKAMQDLRREVTTLTRNAIRR